MIMGETNAGWLIGIDGGQTSTKCVITTRDLRVVGEGSGSGMVHLAAADGAERFQAGLREAVQQAWQAMGQSPQPVQAMAMGLTGVDAEPEAERAVALAHEIVDCAHIQASNDALTALIGAHGGQPGIIVISGTGAIALGRAANGRTARSGGWGWMIGDEGSAMAIGRNGLNAATYAFDGTGPATLLVDAMVRQLEHMQNEADPAAAQRNPVRDLRDCKRIVYGPQFGSRGLASLAAVVSQVAQQDDEIARRIIAQAGDDLARLALGVSHALNMPASPVAPVSGAFSHVHGLREAFVDCLAQRAPALRVVSPQHSAAYGAAILAAQMADAMPSV